MRSFEGAIAAVQRRVRRLRPPITARGRQCEEGFFQWRGESLGAGRKSIEGSDDGFGFRSRRRRATRDEPHDWKRLGIETTRRTRLFIRRLRSISVSSYHQALSRDDGAFRFLASSSINRTYRNQSTFASVPSLFASDSSRSACSASRSAAYGPRPPTRAGTNPRHLILGGCA